MNRLKYVLPIAALSLVFLSAPGANAAHGRRGNGWLGGLIGAVVDSVAGNSHHSDRKVERLAARVRNAARRFHNAVDSSHHRRHDLVNAAHRLNQNARIFHVQVSGFYGARYARGSYQNLKRSFRQARHAIHDMHHMPHQISDAWSNVQHAMSRLMDHYEGRHDGWDRGHGRRGRRPHHGDGWSW